MPANSGISRTLEKMQENTIELAVACYGKPGEERARNELLGQCLTVLTRDDS